MITSWLSLAFDAARHTFAIVCVFEGVRRISTFGVSKIAVFSAVFGLLYCIGYAGFSYWAHNFQRDASVLLHKGVVVPELPTDWGTNLPPQQRANSSLMLARVAFSEYGQLRYYFDETGKKLLFLPTQADLDHREQKVAQLAQLDYAAKENSENPARWLFFAIAAALFGFGWSRGGSATLR
ncbi:hypothetical protein [Methylobacter sp.]|uniref:hypothetical protein n=1 Tax=Methylobacter sp. TaxID=2051955 RepID=UPI00120E481A|nr:hypothetical protein [Methylobacter sp.]TAK63782.1 MAG: hypothetical protein EPO18_05655 [Methylobacter sp.]